MARLILHVMNNADVASGAGLLGSGPIFVLAMIFMSVGIISMVVFGCGDCYDGDSGNSGWGGGAAAAVGSAAAAGGGGGGGGC